MWVVRLRRHSLDVPKRSHRHAAELLRGLLMRPLAFRGIYINEILDAVFKSFC